MKFLLAFACVIVAANALDQQFIAKFMEELQQVGKKCVEETNASSEDIEALMAHNIPASHEGKCMIFCFHKHFHVQKDDGSLDPEGSLKSLDPLKTADADLHEKMTKLFGICGMTTVVDADPCITASHLAECGKEEGKKLGIGAEMFEI